MQRIKRLFTIPGIIWGHMRMAAMYPLALTKEKLYGYLFVRTTYLQILIICMYVFVACFCPQTTIIYHLFRAVYFPIWLVVTGPCLLFNFLHSRARTRARRERHHTDMNRIIQEHIDDYIRDDNAAGARRVYDHYRPRYDLVMPNE